jgi:nucleoside-diphosphate-sugar epimerase
MFSNSRLYKEDIEYISSFDINWVKLKDSTVLITGATGLIGTVLVDALMHRNARHGDGIKVIALARDKKRNEEHFADYVGDRNFVTIGQNIINGITIGEKVDYVIHLASNTHPVLYSIRPIETIDLIFKGTQNVLDFAISNKVRRTINTSSVEIYGENRGDVERFAEDYSGYVNCNTLRAGYPEGKRVAETMCQAYIREKELYIVTARLGRVYGPTIMRTDEKSTSQFIRNTVDNEDIVLKSEGKQEYSYIYVADAVTGLLKLLTDGENGEAYNIANDEVKTLVETAEILAKMNSRRVKFDLPSETEKAGFSVVSKALLDSSKMKKLGWAARHDLKDGLIRTVGILSEKSK